MAWTEQQTATLSSMLKKAANNGQTSDYYDAIAEKTGQDTSSIVAKARQLGLPQLHFNYEPLVQQCIDIAPKNFVLGVQKYDSDFATVAADLHAPAIDWESFEQLLIRGAGGDLFHVGDIFNNDSFSPFGDAMAKFEDEIDLVQKIISYWERWFTRVIIVMGNHDDTWLRKATKGQLNLPMFVRMIRGKNICIVDSTHCQLNDNWFLCHPKEYSKNPMTVPMKLANKWEMNVACGHLHHVGWSHSPSGRILVELGGLMDEELIQYANYNTTSNPFWQRGFMTVEGTFWNLYSNLNNWGATT